MKTLCPAAMPKNSASRAMTPLNPVLVGLQTTLGFQSGDFTAHASQAKSSVLMSSLCSRAKLTNVGGNLLIQKMRSELGLKPIWQDEPRMKLKTMTIVPLKVPNGL